MSKDITEKLLEDNEDVFADIVNGLIFKGKQRISPSDLRSSNVRSHYKADDSIMHEQERDVLKEWVSSDTMIAICGIENQTAPEKDMPLRIFGYEGASYRSQLLNKEKTPIPVVTLILYFGTKQHWNYPRNLKSMMNIPSGMAKYVNDCKINVFEIAWLSEEEISRFKSDFRIVANFFVNKRKNKNYIPNDTTKIEHVDEVLKLLSAMTGDNRYERILAMPEKGQVRNMCEVAERLENRGLEEGRKKGILEGQAQMVAAIKDAKSGVTYDELVKKYGKDVADNAWELK